MVKFKLPLRKNRDPFSNSFNVDPLDSGQGNAAFQDLDQVKIKEFSLLMNVFFETIELDIYCQDKESNSGMEYEAC